MSDNLLDEIIRDLTSETISLSAILRKVLVLASRIDDLSLRDWTLNELNGYKDSEQLPDYRIVSGEMKIDYIQLTPYHTIKVRNKTYPAPTEFCEMEILSGVRTLQEMVDSGGGSVRQDFLDDVRELLIKGFAEQEGFTVSKVSKSTPITAIADILNKIQTRLFNFILEIQKQGLDTGESLSQAKQEQVFNLVNQIMLESNLGDIKMGDTYNNHGQTGAMGKDAYVEGNTFNQVQQLATIDTQQLADELTLLRETLETKISEPANYIELGNVAEAEQEAKGGNKKRAVELLKKVGPWTRDTATSIGTKVVAEVIKSQMGL